MKILFAVNNEKISKSIVKKYQSDYKKIISYKNVYYFNAILKELQKDNTYDRIIISEDLEPFTNNNYEQIDKFIFDKLDNISDEATNSIRADTPIILICADRRTTSDEILLKLFSIGIYNALIGTDRNIDEICKLIKVPRTKKEAKLYYKIDAEEVTYQSENENDVSEDEIQSILAHYKKIGRDEQKCVDSFDSIAQQYTDVQLKVIASFLPLNVKAILEEKSPKYQQIMTLMGEKKSSSTNKEKDEKGLKIGFIESSKGKKNLGRPVIIPSAVNTNKVKKMSARTNNNSGLNIPQEVEKVTPVVEPTPITNNPIIENDNMVEPVEENKPKRRGRPPKKKTEEELAQISENKPKRRGRPPKNKVEETQSDFDEENNISTSNIMPGFDDTDDEQTSNVMPGFDDTDDVQASNVMLGVDDTDDEEESNVMPGFDDTNDEEASNIMPGFDDIDNTSTVNPVSSYDNSKDSSIKESNMGDNNSETNYIPFDFNSSNGRPDDYRQTKKLTNTRRTYPTENIDSLLTRDKKIVSFIGTSKNGTSFLVNNLAESLSKKGINVAILDATKNRNAYYIYTENEEDLRQIAEKSVLNLVNGVAAGLKVDKNLTVYTALPEDDVPMEKYEEILSTLVKNHSLILIDCDFDTDFGYFAASQEIYLVQSMDILTIQPLTAFLRDLQSKNIFQPENLRTVINKELPVKSLTIKTIIGGLSFYNDPSMSFMRELFNRETAKSCTIPFEIATYSKYLEGLVNCKISLNGYSKEFLQALRTLENMVYPLMESTPSPKETRNSNNYGGTRFSNEMNDTLNQMKKNF